MKEKTYLIALVCDLNMEKKQLFYGFAFLHSFIATANKRVWELLEKKQYSGKPYTVTSDWQKFQMKLHYDEIFHRFKPSV